MAYTGITKGPLEMSIQGSQVEQGLVDIEDTNTRHQKTSFSSGEHGETLFDHGLIIQPHKVLTG